MRKKLHRNSGFTLIELMIVIGMIGILTAISVPAVMKWLPNYRLKAAARDLYSNMQKAKMEAVKRNTNVFIVFRARDYAPAGRVGSYQVFVDVDGSFEPVSAQINMPVNVSLYKNNFPSNTAGYNSRGLPCTTLPCPALGNGSVYFQNNQSRYYRVALSTAGNVKITKSIDGATWN